MTTLSKEDVVRMAEELGMTQYIAPNNKFLEYFATLARADIVEANKALVAENERLKSYFSEERGKLLGTANTIDRLTDQLINQLTATRTALAAAEAREEKLREAIMKHKSPNWECNSDHPALNAVLAQPRDDSALRRLLAEAKAGVYEECANVCEISDRYRGDYFAAKIRELAEKAKEEKC